LRQHERRNVTYALLYQLRSSLFEIRTEIDPLLLNLDAARMIRQEALSLLGDVDLSTATKATAIAMAQSFVSWW